MSSRIDSTQLEYRGVLDALTLGSATATGEDTLWPAVNRAVTSPLQMRASTPISRVLQIDNITVTAPITGRKKTIAPINGNTLPNVTSFTVTSDATGAGSITPSSGTVLALAMTASQFLKIGVHLLSTGALSLSKGTAASTLAAATLPAVPSGSYPIGYIYVATDASNNVANIDETNITMYTGGGGGGGGLTTSLQTASFTAAAGNHYLVNTTSAPVVVQMPSGSAGAVLRFTDDKKTADLNTITLVPATGENFASRAANGSVIVNKRGSSAQVMWDGTQWAIDSANYNTDFDTNPRDAYFYDTFEQDTSNAAVTNWITYNNGAVVAPTTGTGGTVNPDFTFLVSNTTPLAGSSSAVLTHTANNRQGHGVSRAFTVPLGYSSPRKNEFTFLLDTTSANYVAGYAVVYIYDITNSTLITPSNTSLPQGYRGLWSVSWDSSTSTSYRVIIHCSTATTTAWTLKVDNVLAGPGVIGQVPAIGPLTSLSPTTSLTNATLTGSYYRVGEKMRFWITVTFTGTPAASGFSFTSAQILNGTGLTGAVLSVGDQSHFSWHAGDAGIQNYAGAATTGNDGTVILWAATGTAGLSTTNSFAMSTGDSVSFSGEMTIAQWQGNGTLNSGAGAQVEYAWNTNITNTTDTTGFGSGASGVNIAAFGTSAKAKRVQFQNPIQQDDIVVLQISADFGVTWIDAGENNNYCNPASSQNTADYGVSLVPVNSTQVDALFGTYRFPSGSTFGAAGATWVSPTGQYKWRVKKVKSSAPVGFGLATSTTTGLVKDRKEYIAGTAYANGTPTVTSALSGFALVRAVLVPYQTVDGAWRMTFNIVSTFTSGATSQIVFVLSGVVFKNISNYLQACSGFFGGTTIGTPQQCYAFNGLGQVVLNQLVGSATSFASVSGDVELDSKPIWMD